MGTLLVILAVLFLALFLVIPLVEKHAAKSEREGKGQNFGKIARWILPMMLVVLVLQLLRHLFA